MAKRKTAKKEEVKKKLSTEFVDNRGRNWNVVLDALTLYKYSQGKTVNLDSLISGLLGFDKEIELLYFGTRHHSRCKMEKESLEDFLKSLTGKNLQDARDAVNNALTTFNHERTGNKLEINAFDEAQREMTKIISELQ